MKLILTRHGETNGNVRRVLVEGEEPLNKNGLMQAEKLSNRLKNEHIDIIIASPYLRSLKTAQVVAQHHQDAAFIVDDEVREGGIGNHVGKNYDDIDWENLPKDMESYKELFDRAKKVLEKILLDYKDKTVLVVAHNAFNKALIRVIRKWDPEDRRHIAQDNTTVSVFEFSEGEVKEVLFNCTDHLGDDHVPLKI